MEEELISKKEVLERMGISYGQLYRWKRKGLIPEGWFIRRSTFTGQETFFPKEKIIERISRIMDLKDDHPLDDLATLIARKVSDGLEVAFANLRRLGWLDDDLIRACGLGKDDEVLSLVDALCLGALHELENSASDEEMVLVRRTLESAFADGSIDKVREDRLVLYFTRKRLSAAGISAEISSAVVAAEGATFDPEIEVVQAVDLCTVVERIKLGLAKEG